MTRRKFFAALAASAAAVGAVPIGWPEREVEWTAAGPEEWDVAWNVFVSINGGPPQPVEAYDPTTGMCTLASPMSIEPGDSAVFMVT